MARAGQIVLYRLPQTDLRPGKWRPALVVQRLPGGFDDWLVCMISTRLGVKVEGFDEVVAAIDEDFEDSGLKQTSLIRVGRLAVVEGSLLLGAIGEVDAGRLARVRANLASWLAPD